MGEWLAEGQRTLASGRRKRARQAGLGLALACGGGRERVHYYSLVALAVPLLFNHW